MFAGYAFGRLLTSVVATPSGVGIAETGSAGLLVAFGGDPATSTAGVLLFSLFTYLIEIPDRRDRLADLGPLHPVAQADAAGDRRVSEPGAPPRRRSRARPSATVPARTPAVPRRRSRASATARSRRNHDSCRRTKPPGGRDHLRRAPVLVHSRRAGAAPGRSPARGTPSALAQAGALAAPRTSSTSPAAHIRSTRAAIRSSSRARGAVRPEPHPADRPASSVGAARAASPRTGAPVISTTSSARTIRRPLLGQDRRGGRRVAAARAARAARPGRPRRARPPAGPARAGRCRGTPGRRATALTYSPDPPTSTGTRPRADDRVDRCAGQPLVVRDARLVAHVQDVQQVVRDAAPLGRRSAWRCRCPCRGRAASSRR